MKLQHLIFACCLTRIVFATDSDPGKRVLTYIDIVNGIPWKFAVSNGVAEINDANPRYRVYYEGGLGGYRTPNIPAIPESTSGAILVPPTLAGYKVVKIGGGAFRECRNLTAVSISPGVKAIGARAFQDCEKLKEVNIPDTVQTIDWFAFLRCRRLGKVGGFARGVNIKSYAFHNCKALTSFDFPVSLRNIDENAFSMSGLTEAAIPHSVTNIGKEAFFGCNALRKIELPPEMSAVGEGAFMGCDHVREIRLPRRLDRIQSRTFSHCLRLRAVSFSENLNSIEREAFFTCPALNTVDFPNSLTNISDGAFANCTSLETVRLPRNLMFLGGDVFFGCTALKRILFYGNAPKTEERLPFGTNVVIEAVEGTKGWHDARWGNYRIEFLSPVLQ